MAENSRLKDLTRNVEGTIALIIWLTFIVGVFSPWEDYITHQEFSIAQGQSARGLGVARIVGYISYLCILLLAFGRLKGVLKAMWSAFPILLLCGWILLSVSWAPDPGFTFNRSLRFLFYVLFSLYLATRYNSLEFVGFLTKGFAITVFASLAAMVLVPQLGYSGEGAYQNAWRGAFVHKNSLGAAMSFGVIVSGYSYLARANYRLLSGITFLGCVLLLIMSRSATAIAATAVAAIAAIVGAAVQSRKWASILRAFALIGLGTAAVLLMILPLANINLAHLPGLAGRSANLTGRTDVWRAVWAAIRERPITGYGYAFWDQPSVMRSKIWLYLNWAAPHSHNNWLDAGLQLGLVGVAITAVIWLTALRRAMWLVFVRYNHGVLCYLTILVACLAQSVVETVTFAPGLAALFWWTTSYVYIARIAHQRLSAIRSLTSSSARLGDSQPVGHTAIPEGGR
jgi:O-antigen ligase